jgi:hypothetical protein
VNLVIDPHNSKSLHTCDELPLRLSFRHVGDPNPRHRSFTSSWGVCVLYEGVFHLIYSLAMIRILCLLIGLEPPLATLIPIVIISVMSHRNFLLVLLISNRLMRGKHKIET